ncbi:MAG: hypothetical protein AAGI45_05230 [Cyanobacteria bacterium P01_H01_bin.26]
MPARLLDIAIASADASLVETRLLKNLVFLFRLEALVAVLASVYVLLPNAAAPASAIARESPAEVEADVETRRLLPP